MILSNLEIQMLNKMSNFIYNDCSSEIITVEEVRTAQENVEQSLNNKFELCSALDTLYYCFSVMLSEVRQTKRSVMSALFSQNPKLAQEKSVLKEKLDADSEYANLHKKEDELWQFIEYVQNLKNNIVYMYKEENPLE